MCGIAGLAGLTPDPDVLQAMGLAIEHRGPDDAGQMLKDNAGFAFRRLSIIDVAGGHQPIYNEDGSAAIMLNGEIYNHHELRAGLEQRGHRFRTHSDVETVLHLWEEKAEGCLDDLRGMFALSIWDERRQELFLARDRVGKKPLYYHRLAGGGLVFGSEIKALLQHPEVRRRPNLEAIDHFLTLQYVPSPLTAFEGVERIPPGSWLRWRKGSVEVKRYWRLDYSEKFTEPEAELREEMLRLLREAVKIRLESEVPLGAFLSGGVDSSAVVAFAAEAMSEPLKTFSIGFEPGAFDESPYARIVAERFGTDHHELRVDEGTPQLLEDIVWHYDQPFGDSSAVPSFHVARITRPHVTVVLNGDGGDESFGGYDRYRLTAFEMYFRLPAVVRLGMYAGAAPFVKYLGRGQRLVQLRPRDPYEAYYATLTHLTPRRKPWLYTSDGLRALMETPSPPLALMQGKTHRTLLDAMLEADVNWYLPDDLLVKMDVATMAHSLEARSPFLDHKLMEFMARVPSRYKLRSGQSKYLLKSALRGILPDEILDRPKMGFGVPLGQWLRTSLRELLEDTILGPTALARGYFRPEALREMVAVNNSGRNDHQYLLWDLLMLEMWHRTYIDQVPVPRRPLIRVAAA
ncbi:MAG: asparagine synthase (glutamine-hydrolyzing) [Chloroflexi bacterium]|nr:MAG: asparagine synthase (glutamine-hydrolyzing) [Chloroflexota bacterium]